MKLRKFFHRKRAKKSSDMYPESNRWASPGDIVNGKKIDYYIIEVGNIMSKLEKPTLEDAIQLAAKLHKGQVDKRGEPYILHPLAVMLKGENEDERMVGVLHDVMEDCDITPKELRELGYSEKIIKALEILTNLQEDKNSYQSFIDRIIRSGNKLAMVVKANDLLNNTDRARFPKKPARKDIERRKKYFAALDDLSTAIARLK